MYLENISAISQGLNSTITEAAAANNQIQPQQTTAPQEDIQVAVNVLESRAAELTVRICDSFMAISQDLISLVEVEAALKTISGGEEIKQIQFKEVN